MKKMLFGILMMSIVLSSLFAIDETVTTGINLLNEFTYYATLIEKENSRVGLDELFDDILNNYSNKAIDSHTNERMQALLTAITELKIIDLQLEHLEILYNYQKTEIIASAIPHPLAVIGTIRLIGQGVFLGKPSDIIQGVTLLAATSTSSYMMYNAAKNSIDSDLLKATYELEYDQLKTISGLRKSSLSYQNTYANQNGIADEYIMNDNLSRNFVDYTSQSNTVKALDSLLSYQASYKYFPLYWLELANLYYLNNEYQKCIDTIHYYDDNFAYNQIYRNNTRYAQVLVTGVASAINLYQSDEENCREIVFTWLDKIVKNTADDNWFQRYYCAIVYMMFAAADDKNSLQSSYELFKMNCNYLSSVQQKINDSYTNTLTEPSKDDYKKLSATALTDTKKYYEQQKVTRKGLLTLDPALLENLRATVLLIKKYGIGSISDISYLSDFIYIPQLREYLFGDFYAEGDLYGFKDRISLKMPLLNFGNKITISIPSSLINDQSEFRIKYDNQEEYTNLYNPRNIENSKKDSSMKTLILGEVSRNKSTDINDYNVSFEIEIPSEWKKSATDQDGFEVFFIIDTAQCPIELFFAGESIYKNELIWLNKDYTLNESFFNNFSLAL